MKRPDMHALHFSPAYLLVRSFLAKMIIRPKKFQVTLAQKVLLLATQIAKWLKTALWPKDVDKPFAEWELYGARLRQWPKPRAEPK